MTKIHRFNATTRWKLAALVLGGLVVSAGQASASGRGYMDSLPKGPSDTIELFGHPLFTTGGIGSMHATPLRGSAGHGLDTNNGNGTSALLRRGNLS
jgi:hypothetical protein